MKRGERPSADSFRGEWDEGSAGWQEIWGFYHTHQTRFQSNPVGNREERQSSRRESCQRMKTVPK